MGVFKYTQILWDILMLLFADGIIFPGTIQDLQRLIWKVRVNIDKTNVIVFSKGNKLAKKNGNMYAKGKPLETVTSFKRLGVTSSRYHANNIIINRFRRKTYCSVSCIIYKR